MKPTVEPEAQPTGPKFEYRHVFAGHTEALRVHLKTRLQPWRWPIMLKTGGIRVEVGSKALPNVTPDYGLVHGNVVVIDEAYGKTWLELKDEATKNFRDYVFCPNRARDRFLVDQVNALLRDKTKQDVPLKHESVDIPHLYALMANLIVIADHPIRYLIIVAHANEFGDIQLPMREAKDKDDVIADVINWESLQEAIEAGDKNPLFIHDHGHMVDGKRKPRRADGSVENTFPTVLPRPERSDGKFAPFAIVVRGCVSGVHTILLNKMRDAFGYMADIVVMPKFFDATHTKAKEKEVVEYFQHNFFITSPKPLTRTQIIKAFKNAKLRDWLGEPVPDTEWSDLVPKDIPVRDEVEVKELSVEVKGRGEKLSLHTWFDSGLIEITRRVMKQPEEPDAAAIQKFLIDGLLKNPAFKNGTGDWPMWLRIGLKSLEELKAFFTYELDPTVKSFAGDWDVHGKRHFYRIRTPLIEKSVLVADYHSGNDGAEATRLIDYNDDRIFGRSDPRPKQDEFPKVGEHFSRLL